MEVESMPLASGYFKAMIDADSDLAGEVDCRIFNFSGGESTLEMAKKLFLGEDGVPDVVGFSVFGWNFNAFGKLAEVYKQLRPSGCVVFGGTHVANQAMRTFATFPQVDVVVNGEGELTFLALVRDLVANRTHRTFDSIPGISFRREDGALATTPSGGRIENLDQIPSPLLTGTLQLRHPDGRQRYDVVLLETNRGCPYTCSFCYWGGATGQKLRKFSSDRIAAELEMAAFEKVAEVVLCDANFGMVHEDEEFVETLIRLREKFGFPRSFETSWAKNKSRIFYSIVERMKSVGLKSSFTLALQTLHDPALELMKRKNMKVNDWRELATWLKSQQLACYSELIWGAPGETYDSFLAGYAALSEHVSRIAVYPLLIMPNTDYSDRREEHNFVLLRGEKDDFEYVISNKTISFEDNKRMHRFIFWARVVAENQILRYIWAPLRLLAGIGQVDVLLSLDEWFERQRDGVSAGVIACRSEMVDNLDASRVSPALQYFHREKGVGDRLTAWWMEAMLPKVPAEQQALFSNILRYDLATMPVYRPADARATAPGDSGFETVTMYGTKFFVRRDLRFDYDIPLVLAQVVGGEMPSLIPEERSVSLFYRDGFATHIDNHEFVTRYVGLTARQLEVEFSAASSAKQADAVDAPMAAYAHSVGTS
jgi:radical SAM C-methyltransferase